MIPNVAVYEHVFYDREYKVTSIRKYGFQSNHRITSVVIPSSVTSIGYAAFNNCDSLTSVEIPGSVTDIADMAFYYCTSLTSVEIGNGVTSIGDAAFSDCWSLRSVEIPSSVTSIEDMAFHCCYSLTSVEIPSSVTSIGNWAFAGCSLTSVEIGNGVTSIGDYAFYYCSSLRSVEIGNGVTSIGDAAFYYCSSLTDVYSLNVTPPTLESSRVFSSSTYEDATLHVPSSSIEDYKNAEGWCEFFHIVGLDSYTVTISISGDEEVNLGDDITISASIGVLLEEYATTDTTYAWYMNVDDGETVLIEGATSDTIVYTPTEAGTYNFYCGVTLNDTTVYSDTTVVEVVAIGSDDSDTGISSVVTDDGTYDVYSIGGVLLMTNRKGSEIEGLPEGVYIIDGKKVAIKR